MQEKNKFLDAELEMIREHDQMEVETLNRPVVFQTLYKLIEEKLDDTSKKVLTRIWGLDNITKQNYQSVATWLHITPQEVMYIEKKALTILKRNKKRLVY